MDVILSGFNCLYLQSISNVEIGDFFISIFFVPLYTESFLLNTFLLCTFLFWRYTNADLEMSLYSCVRIKIIPEILRILELITHKATCIWKFLQRHFIASKLNAGCGGYLDKIHKICVDILDLFRLRVFSFGATFRSKTKSRIGSYFFYFEKSR